MCEGIVKFVLFIFNLICAYAVILCAIFIVEIVIASLAFVYRKDLEKVFDDAMNDLYHDEKDNQKIIDDVQLTFHCCGLHGPVNGLLPSSCCGKTEGICTNIGANAYKTGCYETVKDFILWSGNVLGGVAIGVAVVELIGIIFSCCMANEIKNLERRRGIA
ncbi:hypothetical protein J437_LFUL013974 [Ladona fulva]|uniref:Tetraspanin n=1 Tax=Ladona fulva TaxID=123851 RepID=A0A8K0KDN2_LADFU|nr:hypothetical protein J437_LFUL013974 [Ladona fulva]